MTYKTHVVGGIYAFSLAFPALINSINAQDKVTIGITAGLFLGGNVLGALAPDIDKKNTYISNRAKFLSFIISNIFSHRMFIHLPIYIIPLSYVLLSLGHNILSYVFSLGLILGILSHVFLDLFNSKGIALLYPLSKFKFRIMNVKANSLGEDIFFTILILLASNSVVTRVLNFFLPL